MRRNAARRQHPFYDAFRRHRLRRKRVRQQVHLGGIETVIAVTGLRYEHIGETRKHRNLLFDDGTLRDASRFPRGTSDARKDIPRTLRTPAPLRRYVSDAFGRFFRGFFRRYAKL